MASFPGRTTGKYTATPKAQIRLPYTAAMAHCKKWSQHLTVDLRLPSYDFFSDVPLDKKGFECLNKNTFPHAHKKNIFLHTARATIDDYEVQTSVIFSPSNEIKLLQKNTKSLFFHFTVPSVHVAYCCTTCCKRSCVCPSLLFQLWNRHTSSIWLPFVFKYSCNYYACVFAISVNCDHSQEKYYGTDNNKRTYDNNKRTYSIFENISTVIKMQRLLDLWLCTASISSTEQRFLCGVRPFFAVWSQERVL